MPDSVASAYLSDVAAQFSKLKSLAERALTQIRDEDLFAVLDQESNSIAVMVKHLGGNMRSRWADFLTSDGEKPDRDRDSEFEIEGHENRATLMERWEAGWSCLFTTLRSLTADDLLKTVFIRSEPHSVMQAIDRQIAHTAYHVGQIVYLAKHLNWQTWQSLSIPRGGSGKVNANIRRAVGREGV